jgi:hypothetical protein
MKNLRQSETGMMHHSTNDTSQWMMLRSQVKTLRHKENRSGSNITSSPYFMKESFVALYHDTTTGSHPLYVYDTQYSIAKRKVWIHPPNPTKKSWRLSQCNQQQPKTTSSVNYLYTPHIAPVMPVLRLVPFIPGTLGPIPSCYLLMYHSEMVFIAEPIKEASPYFHLPEMQRKIVILTPPQDFQCWEVKIVNPKVLLAVNSINDFEFPRHHLWWPLVPERTTSFLSLINAPTFLPDPEPACLPIHLLSSPSSFTLGSGHPPPRHLRNHRKISN